MGFENGHSKAGGRKPGRANRRTENLIELLEEHGYSPVADLIEWAVIARTEYKLIKTKEAQAKADSNIGLKANPVPQNAQEWVKIGVSCASHLMPYIYPKRKPADIDADLSPEELGKKTTEDLIRMAEQTISELKQ